MSKPEFSICSGCPYWDDVNGCWRDFADVCDCFFVDEEEFSFNEDNYEEWDSERQAKRDDEN